MEKTGIKRKFHFLEGRILVAKIHKWLMNSYRMVSIYICRIWKLVNGVNGNSRNKNKLSNRPLGGRPAAAGIVSDALIETERRIIIIEFCECLQIR